jgi:ferredoxin
MIRPRVDFGIMPSTRPSTLRACCRCLQACDPAVFLMHQSFGAEETDPCDPQLWRITVMWPTLCTSCMKCVQVCPVNAVSVKA